MRLYNARCLIQRVEDLEDDTYENKIYKEKLVVAIDITLDLDRIESINQFVDETDFSIQDKLTIVTMFSGEKHCLEVPYRKFKEKFI